MDPRCTLRIVPPENMPEDLIAVLPTEVDVEVGRLLAGRVDEPLEVEVQFHGIHIGDAQAIRHHAVGSTPTPHMEEAPSACVVHDVLVDQEVADEAHLLDHLQLMLHTRLHLRGGSGVPVGHALQRVTMQFLPVFRGARTQHLPRLVASIERDVACIEQPLRVLQQLREVPVEMAHFRLTAKDLIGLCQLLRWQHAQHGVLRHGAQQPMHVVVHLVPQGDRQKRHQILRPAPHTVVERTEGEPREL